MESVNIHSTIESLLLQPPAVSLIGVRAAADCDGLEMLSDSPGLVHRLRWVDPTAFPAHRSQQLPVHR